MACLKNTKRVTKRSEGCLLISEFKSRIFLTFVLQLSTQCISATTDMGNSYWKRSYHHFDVGDVLKNI